MLNNSCFKDKLVKIPRLINIKIAKAYLTVSNEALCIIIGLMLLNIRIEEATKYYAITKGEGYLYDREMDMKNWIHPAKHITIIEGQDNSTHYVQA